MGFCSYFHVALLDQRLNSGRGRIAPAFSFQNINDSPRRPQFVQRTFSELCPLPISRKLSADRRGEGVAKRPAGQALVVRLPVILGPSRMGRILVKVFRADPVVLARHHLPKAGEVAFDPVGVLAVTGGILD